MRNLGLRSALLFGCLVTLFACHDAEVEGAGDLGAGPSSDAPEPITQANAARLVKGNLVSPAEAERLARDFARASFGRGAVAVAATSVEADEAGAPALYVFNFKGGGFLVLAADKRQEPVVAFSAEGDFDPQGLRDGQAPEGVRGFVSRTKRYAHDVRAGLAPATSSAAHFDRLVGDLEENFIYPPDPNTCTGSYSYTYELNFPMAWSQGCGWNEFAPAASGGPCDRAWAGCVAVAVGQIMKYHQFPPAGFDWAGMSAASPTSASAWMLRDIADRLGMDWGADGSSADTDDADDVLESYGYSTSASYTDHSFDKLRAELSAGRPAIMRGTRDCDIFGIPTCGGHAWVVTGVKDTYNCSTGTFPRYYKMNWGWGGSYNGWYATYDLTPGAENYNYHQSVVIGIKP